MRTLAAAAAAALWISTPSAAQPPPSSLTEAEFLAPLGSDHPAVVSLARELAEARAAVVAAGALSDPEISATREAPSGPAEVTEVTITWQPPHPARRRLGMSAASAGIDAAAARLDADLLDLEASVREVYARWAIGQARQAILVVEVGRMERLAGRQRHRAEAGEASGLEARRLDLAAMELRADLARAEAEASEAEAAARAWRPDLSAGVRPELPPVPVVTEGLRPEHPRIAALEAELVAAQYAEELAGRRAPMPAVTGGWQREEDAGGAVEGPVIGVAWSVPLSDRRRAERMAARARIETAAARLELARREIAAGLVGREAAYRLLAAASTEAEAAAALGAEAVEAATASFELGEADLTELLDTVRSANAARLARLDLLAAALEAQRELARLVPPPPAERLIRLDDPTDPLHPDPPHPDPPHPEDHDLSEDTP